MIIYDYFPPRIETDGVNFAILPYEFPFQRRSTIRVGSRTFRTLGPTGTAEWERASRSGQYYQEYRVALVPHARIRVDGDLDVHVYEATVEQLDLLNNTLLLVPPDHLRLVNLAKPAGFRLVDTAGRGGSASYMGGLNPAFDDSSTHYDERQCIQITYGALWENRGLNICPTVLHEIGHVMTHGGNGLNIQSIDRARFEELARTRVSRNAGRLEALCNTYMYILCYGSSDISIHRYGSRPINIQRDLRTRNALRASSAFTRLSSEWQSHFAERS